MELPAERAFLLPRQPPLPSGLLLPLALLTHTSWANQLITSAESKVFVLQGLLLLWSLLVVFLLLGGCCYSEGWLQGVPQKQQDVTARPGKMGQEWWRKVSSFSCDDLSFHGTTLHISQTYNVPNITVSCEDFARCIWIRKKQQNGRSTPFQVFIFCRVSAPTDIPGVGSPLSALQPSFLTQSV